MASEGHDPEELIALYEQLIQQVNEARLNTRENEQGIFIANGSYHDIFKRAPIGYEHAAQTYPVLSGTYGAAKPILCIQTNELYRILQESIPPSRRKTDELSMWRYQIPHFYLATMHEMAHQQRLCR